MYYTSANSINQMLESIFFPKKKKRKQQNEWNKFLVIFIRWPMNSKWDAMHGNGRRPRFNSWNYFVSIIIEQASIKYSRSFFIFRYFFLAFCLGYRCFFLVSSFMHLIFVCWRWFFFLLYFLPSLPFLPFGIYINMFV